LTNGDAATVLEQAGGAKQIQSDLQSFEADVAFYESVRGSLLDDHANRWVAVYGGRVVAIEDSADMLIQKVHAAGIPAAHAVIQRLVPPDSILVL